jgi:hypothetical protein
VSIHDIIFDPETESVMTTLSARARVAQKDLSQQYGYAKSSISGIVDIYPRLKEMKVLPVELTNKEILNLARVECDEFRYALENTPDPNA